MFVTTKECNFMFEETWRSRSAFGGSVNDSLQFCRWDPNEDARMGNLILLTRLQVNSHAKLKSMDDVVAFYSQEQLEYVTTRLKREAEFLLLRTK